MSLPTETNITLRINDDPFDADSGLYESSPSRIVKTESVLEPTSRPSTSVPARNGARKLLSHVLLQLAHRHKPPSVLDKFVPANHTREESSFGALPSTMKGVVKGMKPGTKTDTNSPAQDDASDDESQSFSTDDTISLMLQLEDVLATSISHGWQFFDERVLLEDNRSADKSKHSFRISRTSGKLGDKRSRSSSPTKNRPHIPELLSLCIHVLGTIVLEDCRYKVTLPRPTRPPNTLQALTLNIAQFLVHAHRNDSLVISQIAFAMIPAFSTFEPQMHPRLLNFFELNIIRPVLFKLMQLQVQENPITTFENSSDPFDRNNPPPVAIKIDEVQSGESSQQESRSFISTIGRIQSANHPNQTPQIYHLASIFPPLLSAIFDTVDIRDLNHDFGLPHHLLSLLEVMGNSKPDLYNDLLEIMAFRGPKARWLAVAFLANFWPRAVGHSIISAPLQTGHLQNGENPSNIHSHQFCLWFSEKSGQGTDSDYSHTNCRSCLQRTLGFCLRCPLCLTTVHIECYDFAEGNAEMRYSTGDGSRMQRIAIYRFSNIEISRGPQGLIEAEGHHLLPTNWFTLCLCVVCRQPLWGIQNQGWRCQRCYVPVHFNCHPSIGNRGRCGTITLNSADITVEWDILRRSCLKHFSFLPATRERLQERSCEEILICKDTLRAQLQVILNGMAMGSIIIADVGPPVPEFEVHRAIELCEQLLGSGALRSGPLTKSYQRMVNTELYSVLFNCSYLEYVTASIKSSIHSSTPTFSSLLSVDNPFEEPDESAQPTTYECVPISHIKSNLAADFAIQNGDFACLLINQLQQHTFLERKDGAFRPFANLEEENNEICIFPLPLGIDLSFNVEILVSVIESCLGDLNLCINEFAFLLLSRRFWPNGLTPEQGLTRLANTVFTWILDEDEKLAVVLREFIAKRNNLPGTRTAAHPQMWPLHSDARTNSSNLSSNGGDFVVARRLMLSRYALPWLLEFHELDSQLYERIAFRSCVQMVDDHDSIIQHRRDTSRQIASRNEELLRRIIKLHSSSVSFSCFENLLSRSIEYINGTDAEHKPSPLLYKIFSDENEINSRSGTDLVQLHQTSNFDSFKVLLDMARRPDGLPQCLAILPVIVKSGISVSTSFFQDVFESIQPSNADFLEHAKLFIRSLAFSLWLRSLGRQEMQPVIASLHTRLSQHICESLSTGHNVSVALPIIRYSLAACLLIYGCERSSILSSSFVSQDEVDAFHSRKKLNIRGSEVEDPIYVEPAILSALLLYMGSNLEEISCLITKFLGLFIVESRFLEAYETDNFIVRNVKLVATCVWAAYDIQRGDLTAVRTQLLVRHLLVDAQPFDEIICSRTDSAISTIEQRLSAVNRLFRIVVDVTSPAFAVDGRQWRSSVAGIFIHYFSVMWLDPAEEVRMTVKVSSATLLPAHLNGISECWDDAFSKSPVNERIRLIGFLIQLRPYFIAWRVLSWGVIIETLAEYDDFTGHQNLLGDAMITNKDHLHQRMDIADPDMDYLRVSVLYLSLQLLSDGIQVDSFSLMKLKVQFVQFMGFSNITVMPAPNHQSFYLKYSEIPEIPESSFSLIEQLVHLVDSPHSVEVPHSALGIVTEHDDKTSSVLVGSVFVDTILCMVCTLRDLSSLPILTLKSILESLYIIIQKYDFEDILFRPLQPFLRKAILRIMEFLSKTEVSYELRLLTLTIAQTAIKRFYAFLGASIPVIIDLVIAEVATHGSQSQDLLVVQGKLFIGHTLATFCHQGLLFSMMRRTLQADFFQVLKQIFVPENKDLNISINFVCEALLRNTLLRATDVEPNLLQILLQNICTFMEEVYSQNYSSELIIFIGQQLTQITKRMSDGTFEGANPSSVILISSIVLMHNKKQFKEFTPFVDTILRTSLNRLNVDVIPLTKIIRAALPMQSKPSDSYPGSDIVQILIELLIDGLRMKTKMPPLTTGSILEALLSDNLIADQVRIRSQLSQDLLEDSFLYLQNHIWTEENIEHHFKGVTAAATLFLNEANRSNNGFQKFVELNSEKSGRAPLNFRSWNILLFVALQEEKEDWKALLMSYFRGFSSLFANVMRSYSSSGIVSLAVATSDINLSHIAMKLWLMLSVSNSQAAKRTSEIWNELWFAFEGFLDVLDMEAQVGLYPTLTSLATASATDLILYVNTLRSELSLDKPMHMAILHRMKMISRGESSSSKIIRAMQTLSEPQPNIIKSSFLDQIAKELVAAEKIRIVETKRTGDYGRFMGGDRSRKEGR